ncbi:Acyl transferase domain-containing protein [Alteromonadaceae bacterium Bs31]|nr:Acyl transferase domain-containing protein [Alteromonadaceae bacterium Bs31]
MNNYRANDIAVIGMSGAFPGADNIEEFWSQIVAGKCGIVDISREQCVQAGVDASIVDHPSYVRRAAILANADRFDAAFFGYTASEAELIDPQQRLFLQHAWTALEKACYIPDQVPGSVGVFAGCGLNRYLLNKLHIDTHDFSVDDFQKMIASDKDFLASRTSYKLNLTGPSITLQSACSTSLVAVQMGCTALQTYQCDIALCGGASVNVPHGAGYKSTDGLIFSTDGHCRPFTTAANGTLFGEGVGVVALKRYAEAVEDGDIILAVVRGAAVNNDGADKVGYTAPSVSGQAQAISLALELSGLKPEDVDYIETHGTGTKLGDPIEIEGLKAVFAPSTEKSRPLGTLKANVGHLDAAAGIASFIKSVLVAQHQLIPPCLYAEQADTTLLNDSGFYLNSSTINLRNKNTPTVVGVSAFGVGGTNAHVVLTSPPAARKNNLVSSDNYYFPVSAKTAEALANYQQTVEEFIQHSQQLGPVSYTLASARKRFPWCGFISKHNSTVVVSPARKTLQDPKVAFLFAGQGMQRVGMARALYDSDTAFRSYLDSCLRELAKHSNVDIRALLLGEPSKHAEELLKETQNAQPALFITEYCLAKTLMDRGVLPTIMIGHSLGEYVAATIAGVFELHDAIRLVTLRGQLMATVAESAMLSVLASAEDLEPYLEDKFEISLKNAPASTVLSGTHEHIDQLLLNLQDNKIRCVKLKVSRAFHSKFIEPISSEFAKVLNTLELKKPNIAVLSMTSTYRGSDAPVWLSDYWLKHLREPVDFNHGAAQLLNSGANVLLEIGPGKALCSLSSAQKAFHQGIHCIPSIDTMEMESSSMQTLLLNLWSAGLPIDLVKDKVIAKDTLALAPSYPFAREKYWLPDLSRKVGPGNTIDNTAAPTGTQGKSTSEKITTCWHETFGKNISAEDSFLNLGGDSLIGVQLANRLSNVLELPIGLADIFRYPSIALMCARYQKNGSEQSHFDLLFEIDSRGEGSPIFLVAGAHQDRYFHEGKSNYEEDAYRYFSTLVQNLGGQRPVMGFRPRGIFLGEDFHASVEDMAREYIEHLKKIQPHGPYILAGECVGGIVTYELARQLLEAGEEVQCIILMDTPYPNNKFRLLETGKVKLRRLKKRLVNLLKTLASGKVKSFVSELRTTINRVFIFCFPINKKLFYLRNALYGSQIYLNLLLRYKPRPISKKLHLLINEEWSKEHPSLGWHQLQGIDIDIKAVPGDHKTRLTTHGKELGQLINRLVAEH